MEAERKWDTAARVYSEQRIIMELMERRKDIRARAGFDTD